MELSLSKTNPLWHEATWDKPEASIKTETEEAEDQEKSIFENSVLSAEQVERDDVENVASVANSFVKSQGKNLTWCDA